VKKVGSVHVTIEDVLVRDNQGRLFSPNGFGDAFWSRYLAVFERVVVVARVQAGDGAGRLAEITLPEISVHAVPPYRGFIDFLRNRTAVRASLIQAAAAPGACIVRLPGNLGFVLWKARRRLGAPFGVELVGDPADVFGRGGVGGLLRPVFRTLFVRGTRQACQAAAATAYVTARTLQNRYPPAAGRPTNHFSSVELPPAVFASNPRTTVREEEPFTIFAVGSLDQLYKGFDVLIDALAKLTAQGRDIHVRIAGEGRRLPVLQEQVRALKLEERVVFSGHVSRDAVLGEMRNCDLFAMPSRTEGLPRAMIEAMALAVPAIGSRVGGIPELLDAHDMVEPDSASALAGLIGAVLDDPARRLIMSARNLETARGYSSEVLTPRRRTFYEAVARA